MRILLSQPIRSILTAAVLLASAGVSGALGQSESSGSIAPGLTNRSPFLPPDIPVPSRRAEPEEPPSQLAGLYEFRGFYTIRGEVRALIKNRQEPDGTWMRLNESRPDGTKFIDFDREDRSVTLASGGNTVRLTLVDVDPNSAPLPVNGQAPAPTRPTVASGNNDDGNNATVRRRVVPPRPPQWLRDRQRNAAMGQNSSAGVPPPPPTSTPPSLPPSIAAQIRNGQGSTSSSPFFEDSSSTTDSSAGPDTPFPGLPPGGPPSFIPDPPSEVP